MLRPHRRRNLLFGAGTDTLRALIVLGCSGNRQSAQFGFGRKERSMDRSFRTLLSGTLSVFGRSFFPLCAIVVIVGTALWGPWVSLGVTVLAVGAALRQL